MSMVVLTGKVKEFFCFQVPIIMMANRGKGDFEDIESLLKEYSAIYNGFQSLETSDSPSNSQQYQVCLHH